MRFWNLRTSLTFSGVRRNPSSFSWWYLMILVRRFALKFTCQITPSAFSDASKNCWNVPCPTVKYPEQICSPSLDKGFYSKQSKEALQERIPTAIMPKKGKRSKAETEQEHSKGFKELRYKHSAVESNINQLEHTQNN